MDHAGSQLPWNEEQWTKVKSAVTEAFTRASVAGQVLECFQPESAGAEAVRAERLTFYPAPVPPNPARINDQITIPLFTLTANLELTNQQVQDPTLSSAIFGFKRTAALLAQAEDFIVFSGYGRFQGDPRGVGVSDDTNPWREPRPEVNVRGGLADAWGLVEYGELANPRAPTSVPIGATVPRPPAIGTISRPRATARRAARGPARGPRSWPEAKGFRGRRGVSAGGSTGANIIDAITNAIGTLEQLGYAGPYASVVANDVYQVIQATAPAALQLPQERITAMLGGPLLRSGQMLQQHGLVISLSSNVVDLAVATPPKAQFLQITTEGRFLFRVFERFVLRIKEAAPGTTDVRAAAYTFHLS